MKKICVIGAGNIGRGFIGQLFSEAGREVLYLDVVKSTVDALNEAGCYPLDLVSNAGRERIIISPVRAVDGNDRDAAADAIAEAEILVTCVGAKALRYIVPNLAAGIRLRLARGGGPLNLLICENLMDADKVLRSLLEEVLTAEELRSLGLVETSVGRMVPLPDKSLLEAEPLLVRAERYGILPFDRDAWIGPLPEIPGLVPVSPFQFVIERKLYVHNMGHAVCAYLGTLAGYERIADAIGDPAVRCAVREAMTASVRALAKQFGQPLDALLAHTDDLIRRFGNRALCDTCARVGADIPRKLAFSDRLTGAARTVLASGMRPVWHSLGAAAAIRCLEREQGSVFPDPDAAFDSLTGVTEGPYREDALTFRELLRQNENSPDLLRIMICAADELLAAHTPAVM
jgi:mannitol-1-phosphate 5-dehydrogenase